MSIITILGELFGSEIQITEYIDIRVVLGLLALGYCIKHFGFFNKISNQLIPAILTGASIIISIILLESHSPSDIVNGFVNAFLTSAVSIGIHQQGKGFLRNIKESTPEDVIDIVEEPIFDDEDLVDEE